MEMVNINEQSMDSPLPEQGDSAQPPSNCLQYSRGSTVSLTWVVAIMTASVVGGFMFLHDAYLAGEDTHSLPTERLLSHGWHVGLYFVAILALLNALLRRVIVAPIRELYLKLYTMAKGDRERVRIRSSITEIQDIADGINLLLSRPQIVTDHHRLDSLEHESRVLREITENLDEFSENDRTALLESIAHIEELAAVQRSSQPTDEERA